MKNINVFICIGFLILLTISCKKESQIEVLGMKTKKNFLQLEKAKWLLGNWENVTKESDSREIWQQTNDSTLNAESYVTVGKDTVFYEKIELVERHDSLLYIVSVRDQNKEKPVTFYQTQSTEKQVVFENPKHDFPNKIEYKQINKDSIVGIIYGSDKGKPISQEFPMKRSK